MKLRSNEFCPIHKSLSCCGRETLSKTKLVNSQCSESTTLIIREGIGNFGPPPKCGNS
jgi:hypothetical protein